MTEAFAAIKYRCDFTSKVAAHRGGVARTTTLARISKSIGHVVRGNKCIINLVAAHRRLTDSGLTSLFGCFSLPGVGGTSGSRSPPRPERFGSWFSSGSRRSGKRTARVVVLLAVHHWNCSTRHVAQRSLATPLTRAAFKVSEILIPPRFVCGF